MTDLRNSYCSGCGNADVSIIQIIKIECKKCGKVRVIQKKIPVRFGR
ncbi:MAG: hypothetical protein ACP5NX_02350 [Candidatus Bilamarchaeaceae archaeon]